MATKTTTTTITAAAPSYTLASGNTISVTSGFGVFNSYSAGLDPMFSNQGVVISNDPSGDDNAGVFVRTGAYVTGSFGGTVINGAAGNTAALISGDRYGLEVEAGPTASNALITNYGTIENTVGNGGFNAGVVFGFRAGGTVINSGLIDGNAGNAVFFKTDGQGSHIADSVTNTGSINSAAGTKSVVIYDSASSAGITNSGVISNGVYVRALSGESTITNAGTIGTIGGTGSLASDAVMDENTGTLVLDAGQSIDGGVATFGAGSTLEFAGGSAAAVGTLANPASYIGFTTLDVAAGADWSFGNGVSGITTINDLGTLTQTGSGTNNLFIDQGAHDTLTGGSLPSLTVTFGTLGTPAAPNVLDLSNTTATSFAGTITGFGANDQIDIGEFSALPTNVSISQTGTTGAIGAVTVTGTAGGTPETFTFDNVTLAPGQSIGPEVVGQTIFGRSEFTLGSTGSGIALETAEQTVTLSNATPYTLASGQTLSVPGAHADIVSTGGPTTLMNAGIISGASYGVSLTSTSAVTDAVVNTGTITHTGGAINAGVDFGNDVAGSVNNSGYIGGPAGTAVFLKTTTNGADTFVNSGSIGGSQGFSVVDGLGGTGTDQFTNTGNITDGVFLGGTGTGNGTPGTAGTVTNAGAIGTYGGPAGHYSGNAIIDKAVATLVLDAGQTVNNGKVTFGAGSTLDLGAGSIGVGTLVNPGSYFGFTTLNVDAGADWTINAPVGGITSFNDIGMLNTAGTLNGVSVTGTFNVNTGGDVTATQVAAGGKENITGNGTSGSAVGSGSVVALGGSETLTSGGVEIGGQDSGTVSVASGGIATMETVANGGTLAVTAGGSVGSTMVMSGGAETITGNGTPGSAIGSGSVISAGGSEVLTSGGIELGGTVLGNETVGVGSTISNTTIDGPGGTVTLAAGASATGNISFGTAGGTLDIGGTVMPTGTLVNFASGDVINFTGISYAAGGSVTTVGSNIIITDGGHSYTLATDGFAPTYQLVDNNGALELIPCFCTGTRIQTANGPVLVENLAVGDTIVTVREGGPASRKIVWTGKRTIDLRRHTNAAEIRPVRIIANAFGPGMPERDLRVSPHHALFIGGNLFEAQSLLNGATVFQEQDTTTVTYHHIELDEHDLLLAEGLVTESYLDTGNREMFEGGAATVLHPVFKANRDAGFCVPMVREGALLEAARQTLLERVAKLGFAKTDAIGLTAVAGQAVLTATMQDDIVAFQVPAGVRIVQLLSPAGIPAQLGAKRGDVRRLGVSVSGLTYVADGTRIDIGLDNAGLAGFHDMEDGYRWTAGAALVALPAHEGPAVLEVRVIKQAPYWTASGKRKRLAG